MTAYKELLHCFTPNREGEDPDDHEHDSQMLCDWGWLCNQDGCHNRIDEVPCPDHAPKVFPGLRLVECGAEPRHYLWAHDSDSYGPPCFWCMRDDYHRELTRIRDLVAQI